MLPVVGHHLQKRVLHECRGKTINIIVVIAICIIVVIIIIFFFIITVTITGEVFLCKNPLCFDPPKKFVLS